VSFSAIWESLEQVDGGSRDGRFKRRIRPDSALDLFVAVSKPANHRMLLMLVSESSLDGVEELPPSKGVEARLVRPGEDGRDAALELVLTDPRYEDIFGALVADIAGAVVAENDEVAAVSVFIGRLRRWQRFLEETGLRGLASEQQRGLYAELWLLREHLVTVLGHSAAVTGWTGPSHASHDYQLGSCAIEVKATAAKQHQLLRIVSERQLDDTGVDELFLYHLSLDVHLDAGETLPSIVADLRRRLLVTPVAPVFEDKLIDTGYLDAHEQLYVGAGYAIREENFFQVGDGFPRIVERDLPPGVGDVRYSVAVAECKHHLVGAEFVKERLRGQLVES
jgi:hypothetical protein